MKLRMFIVLSILAMSLAINLAFFHMVWTTTERMETVHEANITLELSREQDRVVAEAQRDMWNLMLQTTIEDIMVATPIEGR